PSALIRRWPVDTPPYGSGRVTRDNSTPPPAGGGFRDPGGPVDDTHPVTGSNLAALGDAHIDSAQVSITRPPVVLIGSTGKVRSPLAHKALTKLPYCRKRFGAGASSDHS